MIRNRIGWALALLGAAAVYLFENNGGTRALLAAVIAVPLLSLAAMLLFGRGSGTVQAPETLLREEDSVLSVTLSAPRLFPIRCDLQAENLFSGDVQRLTLRRGGSSQVDFTPLRCGLYRTDIARLRLYDPLGLFCKKLPCADGAETLVLPRAYPLDIQLADTGDFLSETEDFSRDRPGSDPSETFRVREYAPGDPVRQIHWKLSEKAGKTLVRDFGLPVERRLLLLLETQEVSQPIDGTRMEQALDLLASICQGLDQMEIPYRIGEQDADGGAAVWREIFSHPISKGERTVCARWRESHPVIDFAHGAVLSPVEQPELDTLEAGNRITLLIPGETYDPGELTSGNLKLIL